MESELWDLYDQDEVFEYLDLLRETGATNMFGAGPYLVRDFEMSRNDSRAALSEWMRTFGERHPA